MDAAIDSLREFVDDAERRAKYAAKRAKQAERIARYTEVAEAERNTPAAAPR